MLRHSTIQATYCQYGARNHESPHFRYSVHFIVTAPLDNRIFENLHGQLVRK